MFLTRSSTKLHFLVFHNRSSDRTIVFYQGRKYSRIPTQELEELRDAHSILSEVKINEALRQTTLKKKIQALHNAVKEGSDINRTRALRKVWREHPLDEIEPLTKTLFYLGATHDNSLFHEVCFTPLVNREIFERKMIGIKLYPKLGCNVNVLDCNKQTPLDNLSYCNNRYFISEVVRALRLQGAVYGFSRCNGSYRRLPFLSKPGALIVRGITGSIALIRRGFLIPIKKITYAMTAKN